MKNAYHIFLSLIFIGIISWPTIQFFSEEQEKASKSENRALAKMPALDSPGVDTFPALFNTFWDDNFGGRADLIDLHHSFKAFYLEASPVPDKLIIGKDGWLFMKGKPYYCHTGRNKFSPQELASGLKEHKHRAEVMEKKGIPYYVFVAPNKHRIYPEYLPNSVARIADSIQVEQLNTLFAKYPNIHFHDLAPALLAAKDKGRLYHKTDNHWNDLGGYFAYAEVVKELKKDFPNLETLPLSNWTIVESEQNGIALARMMKQEKTLKEINIRLDPAVKTHGSRSDSTVTVRPESLKYIGGYEMYYVNEDTTLPKMLFIRDSFGKYLARELKEQFSEVLFIMDNWEYKLNINIINTYQPDVVVIMVLERNLKCFLNGGSCGGNF